MLCRRSGKLAFLMILALFTGLLPALSASAAPFTQENKPENLKALFELIYQNIHVNKNPKEAAALFAGMIPDADRVRKALKDDVSPEMVQKIMDLFKRLGAPGEDQIGRLFPRDKSAVVIYGATTEEIAAYKEGTVAFDHFTGGAQELAQQVLKPGLTFYQVKLTAPGQTSGITYHLFYWDGRQWSMLAKAWRALK